MRPVQSRYKSIEDNVEGQPTQKKEDWKIQKAALKEKFPDGWQPRKKLSPDALAGIRALHEQFPEDYTTEVLANKFEVSPEAIRRILRSKWEPSPEEEERRQERWFNRGKQVWSRWAELGKKPPTRWRDEGIERKPYRRRAQYEEEDDGGLSETGNNRLIARSKLAKNLM
ncbi:putative mitochondrion organization and biogenesis protein [Phaeoacremonium minimum UCRPA7]|uniref:Required for respiratory growth protein 9, mitochondrial n=1 Tax=Phaeoacremonium minimum (strain UCR-PA7) TaxID=1286976 RepID=R8BY94_PHAM7|nr:putative mitochondrion organization and biogenesis protein [Phaeoacremonium minimum UCRPA7]EOO04310.1 putative mitochondrion organization and biogenesis protein [Phaeoacremonium minimum UCRPA7]